MKTSKEWQDELSKSYLMHWDAKENDPSSILNTIYRHMLRNNEDNFAYLLDYHKHKLYSSIHLDSLSIEPFSLRVNFHLKTDIGSCILPKGQRLFLQSEEIYPMVLCEDIYLQNTKVNAIVSYSAHRDILQIHQQDYEVPLFRASKINNQYRSFQITFKNRFFYMNCPILHLYIKGRNDKETSEILTVLMSSKFYWTIQVDQETYTSFQHKIINKYILVEMPCSFDDKDHKVTFCITATANVKIPQMVIEHVYLKLPNKKHLLNQVFQNDVEQKSEGFHLFESPLSLFQSAYLRCDESLSKLGSQITWRFHINHDEVIVGNELIEEQTYHLFMRKLPKQQIIYEVTCDRIQLEYFHGEWSIIPNISDISPHFKLEQGYIEITFICPYNMQRYTVGGVEGYWLRLTLVKADHCYMLPARHHVPFLKENRFSYTFGDKNFYPDHLCSYNNGEFHEYTNEDIPLFNNLNIEKDCIFISLSESIEQKPLHLYIHLKHNLNEVRRANFYHYINQNHKIPMHVKDDTNGLTHSGEIIISCLSCMEKIKHFDIEGYWILIEFDALVNDIVIDNIEYNSTMIRYDWKHEEFHKIDPHTYPYIIDLKEDDHQDLFEVYAKEQRANDTEWVLWRITAEKPTKIREVQYDAFTKQLIFTFTSLYGVVFTNEDVNVLLRYRKFVPSLFIDHQATIFMAETNHQLDMVELVEYRHADMKQESENHYLERIQHRFQHQGVLCSCWDIETALKDEFLEIEKVKVSYRNNYLYICIMWANGRTSYEYHERKKTLILQYLTHRISSLMSLRIIQPVMVDVDVYVELCDASPCDIETIQACTYKYFQKEFWNVEEYVNTIDFVSYLKENIPTVTLKECKIYGLQHDGKQYVTAKEFKTIAFGFMQLHKVEIYKEAVHEEL